MAVSEFIQIPDQPADGFVIDQPLAGDGLTSPSRLQVCRAALAHDGTGGNATITFGFDDVGLNIVAMTYCRVIGMAAAVLFTTEMALNIRGTGGADLLELGVAQVVQTAGRLTWSPPPYPWTLISRTGAVTGGGYVEFATPNTTGDTSQFTAFIYKFQKEAAQRTPIEQLYRCIQNPGNVIFSELSV